MASADRTVLTESDITTPGPLKTALDSAGGGGAVSSVNGSTGDVVLSAEDLGAQPALSGEIPYVSQSGTRTAVSYDATHFPLMLRIALEGQSVGLERVFGKVNGLLGRSGIQTLTNPTTIPVDGPERLDLVFTEPTTVTFEQPVVHAEPGVATPTPGATDLVLSIEGYEHVTWSGVAVHGTPDQSGVVWASALWRERDFTWHLLCEQDTAISGGGSLRIHQWTTPLETIRDKSPQVLDSRGFVQQEAYEPFPVDITYADVVVDLENPAGGAPIVSYVNVPVMGNGSGLASAFSPVNASEVAFRTPDNASYLKFSVINCKIRGDVYVLRYTVKIKGSPFRADTLEQFDHPSIAALTAPGCGSFVITDNFDIPGFSPAADARPSLTISRPANPASQAPYIRVSVPRAPATSFETEVTVTRSVEGHVGGSGRNWWAT